MVSWLVLVGRLVVWLVGRLVAGMVGGLVGGLVAGLVDGLLGGREKLDGAVILMMFCLAALPPAYTERGAGSWGRLASWGCPVITVKHTGRS